MLLLLAASFWWPSLVQHRFCSCGISTLCSYEFNNSCHSGRVMVWHVVVVGVGVCGNLEF